MLLWHHGSELDCEKWSQGGRCESGQCQQSQRQAETQEAFTSAACRFPHMSLSWSLNSRMNKTFNFYDTMYALIDHFYPEQEITVTSADPHFITPAIKSMLSVSLGWIRCCCETASHETAPNLRGPKYVIFCGVPIVTVTPLSLVSMHKH